MGASRYWRMTGPVTSSNQLDLLGLKLSDGTTDYDAPSLTGTLSQGFSINWDLGSAIDITLVKITSNGASTFPTSFIIEESLDGLTYVAWASFIALPAIGVGTQLNLTAVSSINPLQGLFGMGGAQSVDVQYLVVGGAGGSGGCINSEGEKADGGRVTTGTLTCTTSDVFVVTVGAGGAGALMPSWASAVSSASGSPSAFGQITAAGGLGGASTQFSGTWQSKQGTGGTGLSSADTQPSGDNGTALGVLSLISGASVNYGNSRGRTSLNVAPTAATPINTGAGALAPWSTSPTNGVTGTAGIVILRYPSPQRFTGGVVTTVASDIVHTYTLPFTVVPSPMPIPSRVVIVPDPGFVPTYPVGAIEARTGTVDIQDGGRFRIVGTVAEKASPTNTPLKRKVRLIRDLDGRCIRETWSDATTGAYVFNDIVGATTYSVVSYDYTTAYRAVIADNLTPEQMPLA